MTNTNETLNRRLYIMALLATVAALILFRFFALPYWDSSAFPNLTVVIASVTDSFLGASLAALGVSLLVLWIIPRNAPEIDEAVVIPAREIARELKRAAQSTLEWNYRGHTGRYFRTAILPILIQRSNQHGRYLTVSVEILNPNNDKAIDFFVQYRKTVNPDKAFYWTIERAKAEIIATIVELSLVNHKSPRIDCSIFLGDSVSPFTIDMSSSVAIVTRESSTMAALKYPVGSSFFDSIKEDLHLSRQQAIAVQPLHGTSGSHTSTDLASTLQTLNIPVTNQRLLDIILDVIKNPVNPYPHG